MQAVMIGATLAAAVFAHGSLKLVMSWFATGTAGGEAMNDVTFVSAVNFIGRFFRAPESATETMSMCWNRLMSKLDQQTETPLGRVAI